MFNLDDFKQLKDEYTKAQFISAISTKFTALDFGDVAYGSAMATTFSGFIEKLAKVIYEQYETDQLAYQDKDVFMKRLTMSLTKNINYYFQRKGIDFLIGSNTDNDKYVLTSTLTSGTSETGVTGSTVVQSSASTPTGVSGSDTGDSLSLEMKETSGVDSVDLSNDAYVDKYTNFQGKTNGLHKNKVERDNTSIRSGSFLNAIELMKNLPKTYLDEVLEDVSKHFIIVYDD